jgi:hypothetical protein
MIQQRYTTGMRVCVCTNAVLMLALLIQFVTQYGTAPCMKSPLTICQCRQLPSSRHISAVTLLACAQPKPCITLVFHSSIPSCCDQDHLMPVRRRGRTPEKRACNNKQHPLTRACDNSVSTIQILLTFPCSFLKMTVLGLWLWLCF